MSYDVTEAFGTCMTLKVLFLAGYNDMLIDTNLSFVKNFNSEDIQFFKSSGS